MNIFGNDKGLIYKYVFDTEKLLNGYGVTTVDEFQKKLGTVYDPKNPELYPTIYLGKETDALISSLFINIATLIGELEDGIPIADSIAELKNKLDNNIDPNILLNIIARVMGLGIYNNGLNGSLVNIQRDTGKIDFSVSPIDAIITRNGTTYYKNIGNTRQSINYSKYAAGSRKIIFKYILVVNNVGSTALDFFNSLVYEPTTQPPDGSGEIQLYLINQDALTPEYDKYVEFMTQNETVELLDIIVYTKTSGDFERLEVVKKFDLINSSSFHIRQIKQALGGQSVNIELPSTMLKETVIDIANGNKEFIYQKMGTVLPFPKDELFLSMEYPTTQEFLDANDMIILDHKFMTEDEKVKYPEFVAAHDKYGTGEIELPKRPFDTDFDPSVAIGMILSSTVPIGTGAAGNEYFKRCNAQWIYQAEYPELFAIIGTEFTDMMDSKYIIGKMFQVPNLTGVPFYYIHAKKADVDFTSDISSYIMVARDQSVVIPGFERKTYEDVDGLMNPLYFPYIDTFTSPFVSPELQSSSAMMYVVPADLATIPTTNRPKTTYIWAINLSTLEIIINPTYNRTYIDDFFNIKIVPERMQYAFFFEDLPGSFGEFEFTITSGADSFSYKINNDVPRKRYVFPIKGGYIFEDPFYTKVYTRYHENDLVEVLNQAAPSISGTMLRDRSIDTEKIKPLSITSSLLGYSSVKSLHLDPTSMKAFSLNNFLQDYPVSKLVYDIKLSRFEGTSAAVWSIASNAVTETISIYDATRKDLYPTYEGTSLILGSTKVESGRFAYKATTTCGLTPSRSIHKHVGKQSAEVIEGKTLVMSNFPELPMSDVNKTSAIMMLHRDGTRVTVNLEAYIDGSVPSEIAFSSGVVGGRSGNDYADIYYLSDDSSTQFDAGRCYSVENGKLRLCMGYNDPFRIGIATKNYAFCAGDDKKNGIPIAVAGFIDVEFDGKLKIGDYVTYGKNGKVKKHFIFGEKIGRVLSFSPEVNTICKIKILNG